MQNKIYLITGLMASGKSTVAEILAKEFPKGVHLRGDSFRRMIVSGREEMSDNPSEEAIHQLELRYHLAASAAISYLMSDFTVVLQDNYYGKYLAYMASLLSDYPLNIIVLNPGIEAIKQRESARLKSAYTGFEIEVLYNAFLKETPKLGLWIDSSNITAEETMRRILNNPE